MLKVGHFVTSEELPTLTIYNFCNYRISNKIRHFIFSDKNYDFLESFRKSNIHCSVFNKNKLRVLLKKIDIIHFHWSGYNREEHDLAKKFQIPFLVSLYKNEKLPSSIPFIICPFDFIRKVQGKRDNCVVIYNGIDIQKFKKISNSISQKYIAMKKKDQKVLIAPGSITQGNYYFWISIQELLSKISNTKLYIIGPNWISLKVIKAIKSKRKVYSSIIESEVAIYTPFGSDILKIQNSFHFIMMVMAMGVPCVVSRNKITDEVIRHRENGFIISDETPICFVKGIQELLVNNELRQRCIMNAYKSVKDKFDIKYNTTRYETVIFSLLNR